APASGPCCCRHHGGYRVRRCVRCRCFASNVRRRRVRLGTVVRVRGIRIERRHAFLGLGLDRLRLRQERRELRELVQTAQAHSLQEVVRRRVQDRACFGFRARLLDQTPLQEGAHHTVAVDSADGGHPAPAGRLAVGDGREGLQRGLGEAGLLAVQDEALDGRRVLRAAVEAPAAHDQPQLEPAALGGVLVGQFGERVRDPARGTLQYLRQVLHGRGLVDDHQDGFEGGLEVQVRDGGHSGRAAVPGGGVVVAHALLSSFWPSVACSGGRSNSSVTAGSASPSPPVQRTVSSPSALSWSRATAFSRYSSSRARNRATTVRVSSVSSTSARKLASPSSLSRATTLPAGSCTLTGGAWMWSTYTWGVGLGGIAFTASFAKPAAPMLMTTSGSSSAWCGSRPTVRGWRRASASSRSLKISAMRLYARYCSSRANSRSRASSRARSASSSTSAAGSSRAALRSSRVAATTRNSVVSSRSQSGPSARMYAMNSSVTRDSATSVTSSLCLAISCSSRSNGPSKLASRTVNRPSSASSPASSPASAPAPPASPSGADTAGTRPSGPFSGPGPPYGAPGSAGLSGTARAAPTACCVSGPAGAGV